MGRLLRGTTEFNYLGTTVHSEITAREVDDDLTVEQRMREGAEICIVVYVDDNDESHFDVSVSGVNGQGITLLLDNVADILANYLGFTLRPADND